MVLSKPCFCSVDVVSFKMLLWSLTMICLVGISVCVPFNNYEKFASKVDGGTYCGDGSFEVCKAGQWFYELKLSVGAALLLQACIVIGGLLADNSFILYFAMAAIFIAGGW